MGVVKIRRNIEVEGIAGDGRTLRFGELAAFVDEGRAAGVDDNAELPVKTRNTLRRGVLLREIRTGRVPQSPERLPE